jgi:hypothetical protein
MPRSVNKIQSKWCINKHGSSKIIDTFETYQLVIPTFLIRKPKILQISMIGEARMLYNKIIIDLLPSLTPRRVPKGGRTICKLHKGETLKNGKDLENGSPESIFGPRWIGPP